eukprot:GHVH01006156.1.p1 GENE.GHVH01006156.1~~GHVH01006156.1.p1  ORF type:complete len:745 (+),score=54.62 GHVH01006156.1:31-2265(+)
MDLSECRESSNISVKGKSVKVSQRGLDLDSRERLHHAVSECESFIVFNEEGLSRPMQKFLFQVFHDTIFPISTIRLLYLCLIWISYSTLYFHSSNGEPVPLMLFTLLCVSSSLGCRFVFALIDGFFYTLRFKYRVHYAMRGAWIPMANLLSTIIVITALEFVLKIGIQFKNTSDTESLDLANFSFHFLTEYRYKSSLHRVNDLLSQPSAELASKVYSEDFSMIIQFASLFVLCWDIKDCGSEAIKKMVIARNMDRARQSISDSCIRYRILLSCCLAVEHAKTEAAYFRRILYSAKTAESKLEAKKIMKHLEVFFNGSRLEQCNVEYQYVPKKIPTNQCFGKFPRSGTSKQDDVLVHIPRFLSNKSIKKMMNRTPGMAWLFAELLYDTPFYLWAHGKRFQVVHKRLCHDVTVQLYDDLLKLAEDVNEIISALDIFISGAHPSPATICHSISSVRSVESNDHRSNSGESNDHRSNSYKNLLAVFANHQAASIIRQEPKMSSLDEVIQTCLGCDGQSIDGIPFKFFELILGTSANVFLLQYKSDSQVLTLDGMIIFVESVYFNRVSMIRHIAVQKQTIGAVSFIFALCMFFPIVFFCLIFGDLLFNEIMVIVVSLMLTYKLVVGSIHSSFMTSLLLVIINSPYKIGDRLEVDGQLQIVEQIHNFYTVCSQNTDQIVILPHNKLVSTPVVNTSHSQSSILIFNFKLSDKTNEATISAIRGFLVEYIEVNHLKSRDVPKPTESAIYLQA